MSRPRRILPTIVLAQLACTSLWFAGNAILESLQADRANRDGEDEAKEPDPGVA